MVWLCSSRAEMPLALIVNAKEGVSPLASKVNASPQKMQVWVVLDLPWVSKNYHGEVFLTIRTEAFWYPMD